MLAFSQLKRFLPDPSSEVIPAADATGCLGWRPRRDVPGAASVFFATGSQRPDNRQVSAALETVRMLALRETDFLVSVEIRSTTASLGDREIEIDVYITR
jgi:hypothetical protein